MEVGLGQGGEGSHPQRVSQPGGIIGRRMSRSVRLRAWQLRALERWAATPGPDFLAVATPGAGKTTFALTAARRHLGGQPRARVIVVAPTQHLKTQWAAAAAAFALHLDPAWASRDRLPADMHGVVVTYQQVAGSPDLIRGLARDAFVVFDELHHAGDERAWGDGIRHAFEPAARRLALSGTPFRSDTTAIPFVSYLGGEAEPDFEYGYGDALAEGGVVRPVVFPRLDGHMEWTAPDGAMRAHTFADNLDRAGTGQRLRTALSLEGQWLPTVLDQAHDQLTRIRRTHPDAGGLVIAIDQDHARGIAALLRDRHRVAVEVATSDDPAASARIARFARGGAPWIVAVRMISEGVDVPRLRVGVYATTTATELFFRQAVGRLVRWTRGVPRQRAFLFVPDDPRLRTFAARIAEQRRHSLRRRGRTASRSRTCSRTRCPPPCARTPSSCRCSLRSRRPRWGRRRPRWPTTRRASHPRPRRSPTPASPSRWARPAAARRRGGGRGRRGGLARGGHPAGAVGGAAGRQRRARQGDRAAVGAHPPAGQRGAEPPRGHPRDRRGDRRAAGAAPRARRRLAAAAVTRAVRRRRATRRAPSLGAGPSGLRRCTRRRSGQR